MTGLLLFLGIVAAGAYALYRARKSRSTTRRAKPPGGIKGGGLGSGGQPPSNEP